MPAPREGWVEHDGDTLVVGCNKTKETWYMKCQGRTWMGQMRDCTAHHGKLHPPFISICIMAFVKTIGYEFELLLV